jgi:hypothetical protein
MATNPSFDVKGALSAGYSPAEISDYLGKQHGFDTVGARRAGYADREIVEHLAGPAAGVDWSKFTPIDDAGRAFTGRVPERRSAEGKGDVVRGFEVGFGQTVPLLKGAAGLVGATAERAVGEGGIATGLKTWGLRGYKEGMDALAPLQRETDSFSESWSRAQKGDIGALADWAQYGLGYVGAQALESIAVALGGAVAGAAVTGGNPLGAVAGGATAVADQAAAKTVARRLVEAAVAREAERLAAKTGARVASDALRQQAARNVARTMGAGAAVGVKNVATELGTVYGEGSEVAASEGRQLEGEDLTRMWAAGAAAGALDSVTELAGLAGVAGKIRVPRPTRAVAAGVAVEGTTEAAQTALERAGAGKPLTGPEATRDYVDSAALGALGGGAVGGASSVLAGQPPAAARPVQPAAAQPAQAQQVSPAAAPAADPMADLAGAKTVDQAIEAATRAAGTLDEVRSAVDAYLSPDAPPAAAAAPGEPVAAPAAPSFERRRVEAAAAARGELGEAFEPASADPLIPRPGLEPAAAAAPLSFVERRAQAADAAAAELGLVQPAQRAAREADALVPQAEETTIPPMPVRRGVDVPAARAAADRQAELEGQAAGAMTQADRRSADEQAEVARGEAPDAPRYADLTPMNPRQAKQRLAVLREERPGVELQVVRHPSQPGALAIREAAPLVASEAKRPGPTPAAVQARLEAADMAGRETARRAEDAPRQQMIDRAKRSIEERGGIASPEEARILAEAGAGQPYDRVDDSLAVRPVAASAGPRESKRFAGAVPQPRSRGPLIVGSREVERAGRGPTSRLPEPQQRAVDALERQGAAQARRDQVIAERTVPGVPPRQAIEEATGVARERETQGRGKQRAADVVAAVSERDSTAAPADKGFVERPRTAGERAEMDANVAAQDQQSPARAATAPDAPEAIMEVVDPKTLLALAKPGSPRLTRAQHGLVEQIARVFGKQVKVFRSKTETADGFVRRSDASTIYLNETSSVDPLAVFGHELLHLLRREAPQAYDALAAVIEQNLQPGARERFTAYYLSAGPRDRRVGEAVAADRQDGKLTEELVSDLVGNRFRESGFWLAVFEGIAREQGAEAARGIVARVARVIDRAVTELVSTFKGMGQGFRTDRLVTNLSEVRSAVKQAVQDYAREQRIPAIRMEAAMRDAGRTSKKGPGDEARDAARSSPTLPGPTRTRPGEGAGGRSVEPVAEADKQASPARAAAFKRWFGDSQIVDEQGAPRVMYHGTAREFDTFRPQQAGAMFVTAEPRIASEFAFAASEYAVERAADALPADTLAEIRVAAAREAEPGEPLEDSWAYRRRVLDALPSGPNVVPVFVRAERPFDFAMPDQVRAVVDQVFDGVPAGESLDFKDVVGGSRGLLTMDRDQLAAQIEAGDWGVIEESQVIEAIRALGHDAFHVIEGGVSNLGVFKPEQLKSAIGNRGSFDPQDADIVRSEKREPIDLGALELRDGETLRQRAVAEAKRAKERVGGKVVRNLSDGQWIQIAPGGLNHAASGPLRPAAVAAFERIEDIVRDAEFVSSAPDRQGRNTIREVRYYDAPAVFGGEPTTIRAVVRVTTNGTLYYDHFEEKNEAPAGQPGEPTESGSIRPFTGARPSDDGERIVPPPEEGDKTFSLRRHALPDLSPAQEQALRNVGGLTKPKTLRERFDEMKQGLGMRLAQGIADQFAPISELDQRAYMLARMSKGADGTLEAAMLYGRPFLRDGVPDVNIKDGGFAKVLAALGGEHDRFMWWVAAQRAERLKALGLENLFSDQDITALKSLDQGSMSNGTARGQAYADALEQLNQFNNSVLKLAEESGLIDPAAVELFRDSPYVPFYRVMEDMEPGSGGRFSSGLVNQQAWKKLKGGTAKLNDDLLANLLQNWSHLYAASARNRASRATLEAGVKVGAASRVPGAGKKTVRVMEGGTASYYRIDDAHLLEAVSALEWAAPSWLKPLSTMKKWLTIGVTASPVFKIRNLMRDSIAAIGQSELSANVFKNVAEGWKVTSRDSQLYASMVASGGALRFGTMLEDQRASRAHTLIERAGGTLLDANGWQKLTGQLRAAWDAYSELGDRGENVNRAALYKQLLDKGYSHADASFMARDLIDFSMSGSWGPVRFLAQVVPFLNARIQGLYKLGRAGKENPQRLGYVVGAVALASLALLWANGDDEDWKKREDWDRDTYWWFKIGDQAFRIPKPFEIGAIGTLAERSWELFSDKEMTLKRYGERTAALLSQQLSMSVVPQMFKPIMDLWANKDSFTGRAIESMHDQKLRPQDRYNERTSAPARILSEMGLPNPQKLAQLQYEQLSPKQVDFLVRAYGGWLGTALVTSVDRMARPFEDRGDRPEMKLRDYFLVGAFAEDLPANQSRYVTAMYEQAKKVDQVYQSFQNARKLGRVDEAQAILEAHRDALAMRSVFERATDLSAKIGQRMQQIEASKTLSAATKREMLDRLAQQRNTLAERVVKRAEGVSR